MMNYRYLFVVAGIGMATMASADIAVDAQLGSISSYHEFPAPALDFAGHLWWQFDQMVFLGLGGGVQQTEEDNSYPALGSIWVRLPIGGQVLPVATGDWGYAFGGLDQFVWRAGGGFDIKNGDNSSLLLLGGWQETMRRGGMIYLRGGLLLEF